MAKVDNDLLLQACIRVLGLLATAEQAFSQSLAMGFTTLVRALRYVAEIPFHPTQSQVLRLVTLNFLLLVLVNAFKKKTEPPRKPPFLLCFLTWPID